MPIAIIILKSIVPKLLLKSPYTNHGHANLDDVEQIPTCNTHGFLKFVVLLIDSFSRVDACEL
jgi:hypothetical protein